MIDVSNESLIPINKVPAYLESRGLGKRVHTSAVYRWIIAGVQGVRLESVKIGGHIVTSVEAIQRWVEAREQTREPEVVVPPPPRHRTARRTQREATREHQEAERYLIERRVMPTELDDVVEGLRAGTESARKHVAGLLFRAGMRTVDDAGAADLSALSGIGPKSRPVIEELNAVLHEKSARRE